jgi:hypothetical protein
MALVLGTNCGFVTSAPSADPAAVTHSPEDTVALALKVTAPVGIVKVTEIGWYCDNATEAAGFGVCVYTHDAANDRPDTIVGSSVGNAKGVDAGWKKATVDITLVAGTIYWLGYFIANTATATAGNYTTDAGQKSDIKTGMAALPDPWGVSNATYGRMFGIYAVYTTSGGVVCRRKSKTPLILTSISNNGR